MNIYIYIYIYLFSFQKSFFHDQELDVQICIIVLPQLKSQFTFIVRLCTGFKTFFFFFFKTVASI